MEFPNYRGLKINELAGVFNDTTNSYKFFWFISLLNFLKTSEKNVISIEDLVIGMITEIWYPLNFFKLNFGKQDQFTKAINLLVIQLNIPIAISKVELHKILIENKNENETRKIIKDLSRYVPYRFLTPWYSKELIGIADHRKKQIISELSSKSFDNERESSPYLISGKNIFVNLYWKEYFSTHLSFFEGFTYWHLVNYLQKNNPNVPGISDKLFPPQLRNLASARQFWNSYLKISGGMNCIYSSDFIPIKDYSIDHFLPWSFIAHDQLWNLVPVSRSINATKSNHLPSLFYLDKFVEIQHKAFQTVLNHHAQSAKLLEDYTMLFKDDLGSISNMDGESFGRVIKNNITPLYQIGANMGFSANWKYR